MSIYHSETQKFYTYLYKDIDGTPIYVGKGQNKRVLKHFIAKTHLGNVLRKRKDSGFILEPELTYHNDENTAFAMEIFWIAVYGRKDLECGTLFNLTNGGEGASGHVTSYETKQLLSKIFSGKPAHNKGKSHSPETREKIRLAGLGANNHMFGKTTSEETKAKQRKKKIGGTFKQEVVTCPHCGVSGGKSLLTRFHFTNCKFSIPVPK
jgi:group I intron endonuclease